jgi:hypothetical protein
LARPWESSMSNPHRRGGSAHAGPYWGLVVLLSLAQATSARAAGPEEKTKLDCGVNAHFILLHLEGRPVTLERLESVLPPRHADGYSMAELSAAAKSVGLSLEGVRFSQGDKALARPAIAFVKDAKGGHFVVLRPVGTTGTMVQVIDPPHVPWITDYDRFLTSRPWTGRVLLPRDPWPVRFALPLVVAGIGIPILSLALWRHKRSSGSLQKLRTIVS